MNESDFTPFVQIWDATYQIYNQEQSDAATALVFKLLRPYKLADIKRAIEDHLSDYDEGRFPPKPAHLIKRLDQVLSWRAGLEEYDAQGRLVVDWQGTRYDPETGKIIAKRAELTNG